MPTQSRNPNTAGFSIDIQTKNIERLRNQLGRFADPTTLQHRIEKMSAHVLAESKREAPVGEAFRYEKSGRLREGIKRSVVFGKNSFSYKIYDTVYYARFVKFGTRPHWVVAGLQKLPTMGKRFYHGRNQSAKFGVDRGYPKKALSWPGSSGAYRYVFQNKGIKANPYHERAYRIAVSNAEILAEQYRIEFRSAITTSSKSSNM